MNFIKMYELQKQLDDRIKQEHGLIGKDVINEKLLAFQVELGELANETRCFKYWSKKAASDRETILEEYVDGIHFLLSLGLDLQYDQVPILDIEGEQTSLVAQFILVFDCVANLGKTRQKADFVQLFIQYLVLGKLLNFTEQEIEVAYRGKNEVNHTRQSEGY